MSAKYPLKTVKYPSGRPRTQHITYLKKTIEYCYDHGYRPVLVMLPVTNEPSSRFSREFFKDFEENCREVLREYPGLRYFDYSRDQEFAGNLGLFQDSGHLNGKGANLFSHRLFRDLAGANLARLPADSP